VNETESEKKKLKVQITVDIRTCRGTEVVGQQLLATGNPTGNNEGKSPRDKGTESAKGGHKGLLYEAQGDGESIPVHA